MTKRTLSDNYLCPLGGRFARFVHAQIRRASFDPSRYRRNFQQLVLSLPLTCALAHTSIAEDAEGENAKLSEASSKESNKNQTPKSSQHKSFSDYDWVPKEELTEEQLKRLGESCQGLYLDPMANAGETVDHTTAPIHLEAGSAKMIDGQEVLLEDDVEISQGNRRLHAEKMHYNQITGEAELDKNVEVRKAGILVRGENAKVDMAGNEASFSEGNFVLHDLHMRGKADHIEQQSDGTIVLQKGAFTSCAPNDDSWILEGEKLVLNQNTQQGSGRNIVIRVAGVPIIYAPYLTFPIGEERKTGLLIPVIRSSEGGIDFAQPWYWNMAPNYDMTITPRYAHGHGAMLETEFRQLNHWTSNELGLAFLSSDHGGGDSDLDEALELELSPSALEKLRQRTYDGEDRWLVSYKHKGGTNKRWYSEVDFSKASDIDYIRDLSPASFDYTSETFLSQRVEFGYRLDKWHLNASAQNYQHLLADIDDSYRELPRVNFNGKYRWGNYGLSLKHEYVNFDHRNRNVSVVTGQRTSTDYTLDWNKHWSFGFINPQIGVQSLNYVLDDTILRLDADDRPALSTTYASFDAGLIFERNGGRQTLEPRLFYLYRDYADHSKLFNVTNDGQDINFDTTPLTFNYNQLFRDRRFVGGDRLDDANQIALGVTTRWFKEDGTERLGLSVGQVYYYHDRRVSLFDSEAEDMAEQTAEESDLAGQLRFNLNKNIDLSGNVLFNPETDQLIRATGQVSYTDDYNRLFNIGYRFVREQNQFNTTTPQTIDQIDIAFMSPINNQWQFMGRIFYDLDESKELDTFFGFEYDDCCYRLRVLAQHRLDSKLAALVDDDRLHYDWSIHFEIELKGLASSGKHIEALLRDSIPGFGKE